MAQLAIQAGKGGRKSVPVQPQHGAFVLGSRPSGVRAPAPPRIKPGDAGEREYGKDKPAGNTGETSLS